MPQVPRYGPQKVQRAPIPGVRKTAAETSTSTGAGLEIARANKDLAIAGLGQTVAGIATGLYAKQQQEERDKADETALLAAETQLGKWEHERLYNPDTGAMAVKGKDAMPLPGVVGAEFDTVSSDIASTLTNARQKTAFARVQANHAINLNGTLERHVFDERQKYDLGELQGFVETKTSTAIANANDPRAVGQALQDITDKLSVQGPRLGMGPEAVQQRVKEAQSALHVGVVDRLLADGSDRKARAYFQEAKAAGQISGESITKLEKALDVGNTRGDAQRQSDAIIAAGGTLTEQRAKAKLIEDSDTRDLALQYIEHENTVNDKAQRDLEEKRSSDAYNLVDQTHDVRSIAPGVWAGFSGGTKSALRNYAEHLAKGEPVETDAATYYSLIQQAAGAPGYGSPSDFIKQNLLNYRHKLSDGDWKSVVSLQLSMRNGEKNALDKNVPGFSTIQQVGEKTLEQYGIFERDAQGHLDPVAASKIAALYRMVNLRVDAAQATGQKASPEEVQGIFDDILSKKTTVPTAGNWWALWLNTSTKAQPLVDTTVGDIEAGLRKQIEDRLRAKGRPVSDATVLNTYLEMQAVK